MNDLDLSTGLDLSDAQADYSAFSSHMTHELHATSVKEITKQAAL